MAQIPHEPEARATTLDGFCIKRPHSKVLCIRDACRENDGIRSTIPR